jgi:hypothetical protein
VVYALLQNLEAGGDVVKEPLPSGYSLPSPWAGGRGRVRETDRASHGHVGFWLLMASPRSSGLSVCALSRTRAAERCWRHFSLVGQTPFAFAACNRAVYRERRAETAERHATMGRMLETGTKAPDFTLPDQDGEHVSLSSLAGTITVLYFYPKADTRR